MKKISSRIMFAIIACTLATSLAIGSFTYLNSMKYIHTEAEEKLRLLSQSMAHEFSHRFITADTTVNILHSYITATFDTGEARENPDYIDAYEARLDAVFKEVTDGENPFQGIYFTFDPDLTGTVHEVWYLDMEGDGGFERVDNRLYNQFSDTPYTGDEAYPSITAFYPENVGMGYYYGAIESEEGLWYEPESEPGLPLTILGYSRAVWVEGTLAGVVGIDIHVEDIKRSIAEMQIQRRGYAFLVSENLDVISHPFIEERKNLKEAAGENYRILSSFSPGQSNAILKESAGDTRILYSCSTLTNGWILVLAPDWNEIIKPLNDLTFAIGIITVLLLILSFFAAYNISNRISIPVETAVAQLRHMELGDFNHQIPEALLEREDDLGEFIKSVHTMKGVIKELMKELEYSAGETEPVLTLINSMADQTLKASDSAASAIRGMAEESADTEEKLKKTTYWLLKAQRAGHIGSWERDLKNNTLYWSSEMFRILGLTSQEITPSPEAFEERIHPEDRPAFERAVAKIQGGDAYSVEFRFDSYAGKTIWLNQVGEVVLDDDGGAVYSYGICQDTTERKETLARLEALNADLQTLVEEEVAKNRQKDATILYQSRLAKMGEMIAHIAHQWRQPLNNLSLILSNIRETCDDTAQRGELFQSIRRSGQIIQSMSQTIEDFRNFLNPKGNKEIFSVHKALCFTAEMMENSLQYNRIRLTTHLQNDARIYGYANEFSQVISNVLYNARDALLSRYDAGREIAITIDTEHEQAIIEIFNNGPPLAEEAREKLFHPYFTTKTEGQGTGIGLYMSKIIIEEHLGGRITLENRGEGVLCRIVLPILTGEDSDGKGNIQLQTAVR